MIALDLRWECTHAACYAVETCATAATAHEQATGHRMRVQGTAPNAVAPLTEAQLDAAARAYLRGSHARNVNFAGLRAALEYDRAARAVLTPTPERGGDAVPRREPGQP